MIEKKVIEGLRKRFPVHPLVFQRSVEYASSPGELFDILDTTPECPFTWDEKERRWIHITDVSMSSKLMKLNKRKKRND